jgi:alanine racemase
MASAHAPERALARIRPRAIEHNCSRLASLLTGGAELCAVVKADGYGHGDHHAARAARAGGAAWIAVATAGEAVELRRHGLDGRILVMGALTPTELRAALEADADVVAWRPEFVAAAAEHAVPGARPPRVHVKHDTGMGRLGERDGERALALVDAVAADDRLQLVGAMTHFATADERGDDLFGEQLERFTAWAGQVRVAHPDVIAHAANSAATLRDPASHFDLVRCGVAVYGLDPFQRDPGDHELEPALALESYVARIDRFEPGEGAGYGRKWTAERATDVATLPIGYGDGWRRALTNDCDVLIGGRRQPLVGTVSMDNITVELGPDHDVAVGDPAVLIGAQGDERVLCEEVAERIGTINYEVTCGLTARVRRFYEP